MVVGLSGESFGKLRFFSLFWGNHLNYFCIKLHSIDA